MTGEIYLDNHSTTRTDPRVVEAMLPWMLEDYGNPGSASHEAGRRVAAQIDRCRESIAHRLHTDPEAIVFTSGATESIQLALLGTAQHPRQRRRKLLSSPIEHPASLACLKRLQRDGFAVELLPVLRDAPQSIGRVDLDALQSSIDEQTAMVSIMLGNNEIGTIDDIAAISRICRAVGALLHVDATQAVGKLPIDIAALGIDLMSFSAHKFYGPKGVGGLIVHQGENPIRLQPQALGGGQQHNLRSGTLNSPSIIGMTTALELALDAMPNESLQLFELRQRLWDRLAASIPGIKLNGPAWSTVVGTQRLHPDRLHGNLNICLPRVEGQSLMLKVPQLAVSSGSACTSAAPHPSHVLLGIGLTEDQARTSLRFGIGRFNTTEEIDRAAAWIAEAYHQLVPLVA